MDKTLGFLKLKVIRGVNLAQRDRKGSDPYVVVRLDAHKLKTRVVKRNVNPIWNEDLTLSISDPTHPIRVEVYDKDTFSFDDPMGNAEIDIQPFMEAVRLLALHPNMTNNTIVKKELAARDNCLSEESKIYYFDGKIVQDMFLRLRNVESGEKTDDREITNSDSVVIPTETGTDSSVILSDVTIAASSETHTLEEERASTKIQAGIIKLQALVRGHLVRRQALATLLCVYTIVRFQTRAHKEKDSEKEVSFRTFLERSSNPFICKLASIKIFAPVLALQIEYFNGGSNSTREWLERWTRYQIWKPLQQSKKTTPRYAMETKSGNPSKHVVKHNLKNVTRNSRRDRNSGDGEYYNRDPTVETIELAPIGIVTPKRRQYRNDEDRLDFCEMMNQAMQMGQFKCDFNGRMDFKIFNLALFLIPFF
ncbi:hypothetical protein ZOSMA_70G00400 [Zostera marina]|uniref:C2 domain-containing protein n=1 Tax=Zostera marina TaxID=29655 RepID=A0A0K9NQI6_ZOSMR|nr:hypothetical protein ZOSMA_70G00400 [Zostera marina]